MSIHDELERRLQRQKAVVSTDDQSRKVHKPDSDDSTEAACGQVEDGQCLPLAAVPRGYSRCGRPSCWGGDA